MTFRIYRRARPLSILLAFSFFFFLALAEIASAADISRPTYQPLVGIPGITDTQGLTLAQYINAIYLFTISVGALIGVIKISMAGVKYSMSDVITDKASAKKDIMGVLLGLAILLIPFIVLNTIYSGLTNLDVLKLKESDKLQIDKSRAGENSLPTGPTTMTCASRNNGQGMSRGECMGWCLNTVQGRFVDTPEPACISGG